MHLFISAGEPSGDLHGSNLVRALRRRDPSMNLVGFGGERMAEAGCRQLYPLCDLAVMGFVRVVAKLPTFVRVLDQAEEYFRRERPDALVMIDFPGFHWQLAKRAKRAGVPVYYFVPPQLWAWAGWRVRKMRRLVDRALSALPFEHDWFRERGVASEYVGHPYFDELAGRPLDQDFLDRVRSTPGRVVGLLPGSRRQEIVRNLPMMLSTARRIVSERPDTRFLVASLHEEQAALAREVARDHGLPLEIHARKTPEIIEASEACVSVSGSVSLELMYRRKPTAIVYKVGRVTPLFAKLLLRCRYITLVNLLAGREVFPEFASHRDVSAPVADRVLEWLASSSMLEAKVAELDALREVVARPGACERAAEFITGAVNAGRAGRSAA